MYLSKKQIEALQMALEAMDYRNGGAKDEEQEENYNIILDMIDSSKKKELKGEIKNGK